jgi:opacity protein-like surface antigen
MQSKRFVASLLPAAMLLFAAHPGIAQVAPSARVGGLPVSIGVGMSSFNLDYGQGRRMEGPVVRGGIDIWHGVGVDASARSIFMFTPTTLSRMQQTTFLVGAFYEGPKVFHVRPFARFATGKGIIEFPSDNPKFTRGSYLVFAPSGGVEVPLSSKIALRADYEYEGWRNYRNDHDLTPQGYTIGVDYYLNGIHRRPHPLN